MILEYELLVAKQAAIEAGEKILQVYHSNDFQIEFKGEDNPVGLADKLSNIKLCEILNTRFPTYGILSEESISESKMLELPVNLQNAFDNWRTSKYTWMIDPLDGTKDFIKKTGDFGIHVGLIKEGQPILGVNYYPVTKVMYYAIKGEGGYKEQNNNSRKISVSDITDLDNMTIVTSRSNPDSKLQKFIDEQNLTQPLKVGGMGLKICKVADGSAELYVLFNSKSSLWDSCSAQVILKEAGGEITDFYGNPINYRQKNTTKLLNGILVTNGISHNKIVEISKKYI